MRCLRLILALGAMVAGLAGPAFASSTTKHKTYHHETSYHETSHHTPAPPHHTATKHEQHHETTKKSTHHAYRKPSHKTYHPYVKPKPKPGIRSDGRYVLPGGLETTCAGGTPPPCR